MQQDWENTKIHYAGKNLQASDDKEGQVFASKGARAEFGWLIDKMPEWAGRGLDLVTDLDITGGIDPSSLDDTALDQKAREFITANSAVFKKFTKESLDYFISGAKRFVRYGADGAQCFKLEGPEKLRNVLFIQSVSRRNFSEISREGLGCALYISPFDDAAITVMHECGHLLKQHFHMNQMEALRNETEAEGLMITSFMESVHAGRDLDPESLQTRLAFRSLQSILWTKPRDIGKINDPLGPGEGFSHGVSAALSLVDSPLALEQAAALLRAPIQVNTLTDWLAGDSSQERPHYFSAMTALYSEGYFGENTLAEVYVRQALQACRIYAKEWLDKDLISDFKTRFAKADIPRLEWDHAKHFFKQQHGRYIDPVEAITRFYKSPQPL